MKLAIATAAALLAATSFTFAADNGGKNGGKDGMPDNSITGSISDTDRFDPPDEKTVEQCKTAPADDMNCKNALSR